jgi:transcriptional regulator of acetoin/glycerol metabolism
MPVHDRTESPSPSTKPGQLHLIVEALTQTKGNISQAAKELGLSRPALHDLLDKHGIEGRLLRPTADPQ